MSPPGLDRIGGPGMGGLAGALHDLVIGVGNQGGCGSFAAGLESILPGVPGLQPADSHLLRRTPG